MVKNCLNVILMLYIAIFIFFRTMTCFALSNNQLLRVAHERGSGSESVNMLLSHKGEDQNIDALFSAPEQNSILIDAGVAEDSSAEPVEKDRSKSILSVSGEFRNETAYRIDKPHHLSTVKNVLNMKSSGTLSDNLSYFAGARLAYDAVFDLTDQYNHSAEADQELNLDLRDAYIDLNFGKFDLRLGNQQIVWGEAVGLFFADIVNPKDLREYILSDLEQTRIPVPAVNLEYYPGSLYLQFIFIPYPEFNEFGKKGSEFDFSKSIYAQNADIVEIEPEEPANSLDNSELGFRASKLIGGWDLSVFYLYDYYNFAINYRYISINPLGTIHPVTITYRPEYKRMHKFGHTFSKEYMNAVFKGEFIYSHEMFISSLNLADLDGIIKSDTFKWLLGVDYTFFKSLETNFQLMQEIIMDYQADMAQKEYSTSFSIWMKTGFFEDKIEPELFIVSSFNQMDYLFRSKITYNYNDCLKFICGVDIFYGENDGDFGAFDKNDRLYIEILYHF